MVKKTELDEDTVKATRGPNEVEGDITPQGGTDHKRKADDTSDKESMKKVEGPKEKMSEAIDKMFEGEEFSEDFKEKVKIVFEAAVSEEVSRRVEELEEDFDVKLNKAISTEMDEIVESVDSYLDILSDRWIEENKLAIESSKKIEMAESFIEGLAYMFKEHNLDVDQEESHIVEDLEEEVKGLKAKINDLGKTLKESYSVIKGFERKEIISELTEGLSESDKDRMNTLTEAIEFATVDEFKRKASIIKENFFGTVSEETDLEELNEEGIFEEPKVASDTMSKLYESLKKINNPY